MKKIINGKVYDTKTAELIADNEYWDGNNMDRNGRNTYLYKTKKGRFFLHETTRWQGERDYIEAISDGEAKCQYEELPEHAVSWEDAFGEAPEEA